MNGSAALADPLEAIIQGSDAWHDWRRGGIGASEAPIVTGDSRWGSRTLLYHQKIGEAEPTPATPVMRLGSYAEPLIAEMYAEQTGRAVSNARTLRVHPEIPWMRASIDRWAGERIVECKLAGFAGVDWGTDDDEPPAHVIVQVQHQLAVTGAPVADVAKLGRDGLTIYTIEPDARLIELLVAEEDVFWTGVLSRTPPPIDGDKATSSYLSARYPADTGAEMVADSELIYLVNAYASAKADEDVAAEAKETAKNAIKARMGEIAALRGPNFRVSWRKSRDGTMTDWEALAAGFLRQLPAEERTTLVGLHSAVRPGTRRFLVTPGGK